jgi:urease accessory protein
MRLLNLKVARMAHTMADLATHMMMAMTTLMRQQASMLMNTAMNTLMSMGRTASMTTELLQLIWLASPALPVGGFSYSEALEAAIDHAHVHDESSCANWLADQLHLSQARGDMALMAQAIPAWQTMNMARLQELSAWVHATRETQEMRLQTEQMGRSLLDWLRIQNKATAQALKLCSELRPTYPMAMSLALSLAHAPLESALQAYAFGWAENMTQAALKAVPLGQISGQKILARLAHEIPQAVQHAMALSDHDRQAFCPMLAVMSARHETQYSRLFRS